MAAKATFTFVSIAAIIALLFLGFQGLMAQSPISQDVSDQFVEAAKWLDPSQLDVGLGNHPFKNHPASEVYKVRDTFLQNLCQPDKEKQLNGRNDYQGFHLFACIYANGRVAIWILVEATRDELAAGSPHFREVTAFISDDGSYLKNLLKSDLYRPIFPGQ